MANTSPVLAAKSQRFLDELLFLSGALVGTFTRQPTGHRYLEEGIIVAQHKIANIGTVLLFFDSSVWV